MNSSYSRNLKYCDENEDFTILVIRKINNYCKKCGGEGEIFARLLLKNDLLSLPSLESPRRCEVT